MGNWNIMILWLIQGNKWIRFFQDHVIIRNLVKVIWELTLKNSAENVDANDQHTCCNQRKTFKFKFLSYV